MEAKKKIVVVGGGFGGLSACQEWIRRHPTDTELTLVDQKNHHLFQPLLYQVATAGLSPAEIAVPLRNTLKAGRYGISVVMDKVTSIDVKRKLIQLGSDNSIPFDFLLLACGASHSYFSHPEWEAFAPGLKTLEQALSIRSKILKAFEEAETCQDPQRKKALLHFVVVGGGPTGVELAGAIAEISLQHLNTYFSHLNKNEVQISLIEAGSRILPPFSERLSERAHRDLSRLGVQVFTGKPVTHIESGKVFLGELCLESWNVIWAAGVKPSPLATALPGEKDRLGRVKVEPTLQVKGLPGIFAVGDMACFELQGGKSLPGLAPVALQQGKVAMKNILNQIEQKPLQCFKYQDKGSLAIIGKRKAVGEFKGLELTGFPAWSIWLLVHLVHLVGFRNKLFVFLEWVGAYLFQKKGARLIN